MPEAKRRLPSEEAARLRRGLDLRQLQVFVEVAAAQSVTSAANSLGISQAAASQQIARLEERLGLALLHRSSREIRLTTAGARLVQEGRQLLSSANALFETLEPYRATELPSLRLHILESLATMLVPPLVPRLRSRIGQLEIHCALQLEREHDLIFDDDAVAVTSLDLAKWNDSRVKPILDEPFVALFPRHANGLDHRDRAEILRSLSQTTPFIRYLAKRRMAAQVETVTEEEGLVPRTLLTVDSSPTMVRLVAAGCGWTITTPSCLLTAAPDPASLWVMPLSRSSARRRIVLIADEDRLMDVPGWIAEECRSILCHDVIPQLKPYGEWIPAQIKVGCHANTSQS